MAWKKVNSYKDLEFGDVVRCLQTGTKYRKPAWLFRTVQESNSGCITLVDGSGEVTDIMTGDSSQWMFSVEVVYTEYRGEKKDKKLSDCKQGDFIRLKDGQIAKYEGRLCNADLSHILRVDGVIYDANDEGLILRGYFNPPLDLIQDIM
jgi:hypothetical protein